MSAETMKRLFEPFFSTKAASSSVGLGLSVCYGIIRQYHGAITAESKPGQGSIFIIWLPRAVPSSTQKSASHAGSLSDEFKMSGSSL
jgi:two-component system cell cycle sensor histidine kinase/response regulator CckA